jgi:hypothetical protein
MASCYPTSTSTPYPTLTPTPGCDWRVTDCIFATPTPPLYDVVTNPGFQDSVQNTLPSIIPSLHPFDANGFWNTMLQTVPPFLGIPASSLNQVTASAGAAIASAGAYVVNAAINVTTTVGNATNNIGIALNNASGIGPTLPAIFFNPSNFISPLSAPTISS